MSPRPSFAVRSLMKAMHKSPHGRISLRLPDGTQTDFGHGELACEGKIHRWDVLDQVLRRGDIGFAETYIEGSFEIDHPDRLIEWACRNESTLKKAIYGAAIPLAIDRIRHWRRSNTVQQAKKNIASHYDLGNEFYKLWLDPTLTYSSALFTDGAQGLESAQVTKFERILNQAGVKAGDHILEIGCGWGGFFSHAVRTRNCRVTAVTISQRQFEVCQKRIESEGLGGQVTLLLEDYRHLKGKFDHIVSIEMIEAVGQSYWPSYFGQIQSLLKATGRAVIQSITIREDLFKRYTSGTDFIQQYVFPGGQLPTLSAFSELGNSSGLNVIDMHAFPGSYARTLKVWREQFKAARKEVQAMGFDEEFLRLWEFYLAYCEGAFRVGRVGVSHFTLEPITG